MFKISLYSWTKIHSQKFSTTIFQGSGTKCPQNFSMALGCQFRLYGTLHRYCLMLFCSSLCVTTRDILNIFITNIHRFANIFVLWYPMMISIYIPNVLWRLMMCFHQNIPYSANNYIDLCSTFFWISYPATKSAWISRLVFFFVIYF